MMSPGEFFITLIGSVAALFVQCGLWYRLAAREQIAVRGPAVVLFSFTPIAVGLAILLALRRWASFDVRDDVAYLVMYGAAGVAWVAAVGHLLHLTRLSWLDDVIERDNPAAQVACVGLLGGATAAYVGGNIGDGPGWWVVVYASGMASLLWFATLEVLHRATGIYEKVTLDLDVGAGFRLAGFAVAAGLLAGRGAAGDWYSFKRMLIEFAAAWPLLPLLLAGIAVERSLGATPLGRGREFVSALIAAAFIVAAAFAIADSPPLTENPWYGSTD